jgi:hypothetical protein
MQHEWERREMHRLTNLWYKILKDTVHNGKIDGYGVDIFDLGYKPVAGSYLNCNEHSDSITF